MPTPLHESTLPAQLFEPALRRPVSCGELFRVFNRLALQGFGGVLAIAQHELVDRERWLSRDDFLELLSVCQVLPGPNIVNLSLMVGDRFFGLRGACAALGGMLLLPLVIMLSLAALYARHASHEAVSGALRGMGAVAAGLALSTAGKLLPSLRRNPLGMPLALALGAATLALVAVLKLPLVAVVAGLGALAVALAWWRLDR
jgi:chromate transporter